MEGGRAIPILISHQNAAVAKLVKALEEKNADIEHYARSYLRHIARSIERQVRQPGGKEETLGPYRERVRSLAFNIAKNRQLQAALCRRELDAPALCAMSAEALASEEERARRQLAAREQLRRVTRNEWADMPRTDRHPCPLCRSCIVAYEHVSGARDNRKAETWGGGNANENENAVRFGCQQCGHDWTGESCHL